jgi:hypothetical protein
MIFEMDCKMIVDDVYNQKQKFLNMVHLLINCRTILSHHSNFIIGFTRRQANKSVHALAWAAQKSCSYDFWCYSELYYYYYNEWNASSLFALKIIYFNFLHHYILTLHVVIFIKEKHLLISRREITWMYVITRVRPIKRFI